MELRDRRADGPLLLLGAAEWKGGLCQQTRNGSGCLSACQWAWPSDPAPGET